MTTSEDTKVLVESLVKAQLEFPPIAKSKTAKTPKYSYEYADYAAILETIRPILNRNGIAVIQGVAAEGKCVMVTTRLAHFGGGWMESTLRMEAESAEPQKLGSAISYARRYGFLAMVGAMPQEEDDDGAKAQEPSKSHYPRESSKAAGEALAASLKLPERKLKVLEYLWARHGKDDKDVRNTLARMLGHTFPIKDEIRLTLGELEQLEKYVEEQEIRDIPREV